MDKKDSENSVSGFFLVQTEAIPAQQLQLRMYDGW
jgi:hypothetical protein